MTLTVLWFCGFVICCIYFVTRVIYCKVNNVPLGALFWIASVGYSLLSAVFFSFK